MKNIYLVGIMGCGKSAVGKVLAEKLNLKFCDMDEKIEKDSKCSINDIFSRQGEEYFRELETKALISLSKENDLVVSTGGGVILKEQNAEIMKKSGVVIWIQRDLNEIIEKVSHDKRPLLKNDPQKLFEIFEKRKELYEKSSDFIIENSQSIENAVNKIIEIIKC